MSAEPTHEKQCAITRPEMAWIMGLRKVRLWLEGKMALQYSGAVLRSIGSNNFSRKTLGSLEAQTITPDEMLIVIRNDIALWQEKNLSVRLIKSKRSMVSQLMTSSTRFTLSDLVPHATLRKI